MKKSSVEVFTFLSMYTPLIYLFITQTIIRLRILYSFLFFSAILNKETQNWRKTMTGSSLPPLYIDGYFTRRLLAGEEPKRGYPKNPLPEVPEGASMEVVTGFMAGRGKK